jgi:peptidyl-prolyl cis-trans isomerase SurA
MMNRFLLILICVLAGNIVKAQNPIIINEVVAIMGNRIVMKSDIEERVAQMLIEGSGKDDAETRCRIIEDNLFQKMLVYRASVDSVVVSADQIEGELQRRIEYFIKQFPSQEAMEEYLGKTIPEIKKEFRAAIEEQLMVQQMQEKVTGNIKVTPGEVRVFYAKLPKDSLPYIPSEIEVAQIVVKPKVSEEEKRVVRDKLNKIRNDILRGSSFTLKAKVNSMDRASAEQGGELGLMSREELVQEFSAVAFRLKPGEISEIVESEFGFHIIELVEKRGELANFRHILLKPEIGDEEFMRAQKKADSLYSIIGKNDTLTFEKVAQLFSDDEETKHNGGRLFNFQSGSGKFKIDQMDMFTYREVSDLNPGDVSKTHIYDTPTGGKAFRIMKLVSRSQPHQADLKTDYQIIQAAALAEKQGEAVTKYINKMKETMYIQISPDYKTCDFQYNWDVPVK